MEEETPKETANLVEKADAAAARLEAGNKKAEELVTRLDALAARMLLGGKSDASNPLKSPERQQQDFVEEQIKKSLNRFK